MSGPPPPPPPGPPPPPAMAPPALSKSEQQGRSALLTDITKGTKLKSSKHLMNDRSGLPNSLGGNQGKGGGGMGGHRPVMPQSYENGRITSGRSNTGRSQPTGGGAGGGTGSGGVRNAPPGLGDLFGGGMPKLRPGGNNATVGRSATRQENRVSNGSLDGGFPPPPPPPTNKPSLDFSGCGSQTVGRSGGNRMSGLPPPPSPSQLSQPSRPLPNVPPLSVRPSLPSSPPPPPPTRGPSSQLNSTPQENGPTHGHGYNGTRALPPTPTLPPKPPERKESVAPPPPVRTNNGPPPPPPPNRGPPPVRAPPPVRPPGRSCAPTGPPPGTIRGNNMPPPPPVSRPPAVQRSNSIGNSMSDFESMFRFSSDLPAPEPFMNSVKTYPSQNPNRKGSTANRRPVPPPPPPGGL